MEPPTPRARPWDEYDAWEQRLALDRDRRLLVLALAGRSDGVGASELVVELGITYPLARSLLARMEGEGQLQSWLLTGTVRRRWALPSNAPTETPSP
jgi:hypothetical protein